MRLQLVGCSHHDSDVAARERMAFSPSQTMEALQKMRHHFAGTEAVLLSTCNRVEFYLAADDPAELPSHRSMIEFLAEFHGLDAGQLSNGMLTLSDEDAVRHLFLVASSLDSMVLGEAQVLSQVKEAFAAATVQECTGPITRHLFETANRVAKRVATETAINRKRVSIPSVAVGDYAKQLFETLHDKNVLIVGAGQMGQETLRYLRDEGARNIVIVNRSPAAAVELAQLCGGTAEPWEQLSDRLVWADLIVSTTGSRDPIVSAEEFRAIDQRRSERLLFILDLAVPRDFDEEIRHFSNVYLYCVDDLRSICDANRRHREKELPKAKRVVDEETARCLAEWQHRATGPTIQRLKQQAQEIKSEEFQRLVNKLGDIDNRSRDEIERSFDRLVNKILHPPLQSLRDEVSNGSHHSLVDALRRLFQISD